jgi:hypothetical protein
MFLDHATIGSRDLIPVELFFFVNWNWLTAWWAEKWANQRSSEEPRARTRLARVPRRRRLELIGSGLPPLAIRSGHRLNSGRIGSENANQIALI